MDFATTVGKIEMHFITVKNDFAQHRIKPKMHFIIKEVSSVYSHDRAVTGNLHLVPSRSNLRLYIP